MAENASDHSERSAAPDREGPEAGEHVRVPIAEERARIETRDRVVGRVRVSTRTHEEEVELSERLRSDRVEITRVAIDAPIDYVPEIREENGVIIVPVVEEVLIKRLVLREEVHLRHEAEIREVTEPVTLRTQEATVERTEPDD